MSNYTKEQLLALLDQMQAAPQPPAQVAQVAAPSPAAYRCGLADTSRVKGSLCGKQHCSGCAPYRTIGAAPAVAASQASIPTKSAPAESLYIDRTTHEVLLARAVRESYEKRRGDRRDRFIAAALQGRIAAVGADREFTPAEIARDAINFADAIMKADGDGNEPE